MQASHYHVLTIGVNIGPDAPELRVAEKDAQDVHTSFVSPIGPPGASTVCLLGQDATVRRLANELDKLKAQPPLYLLIYFSGHGSDEGILLRDGLFRFEWLAKLLRQVDARSTIVILDSCHAAAYGRHVKTAEVAGIDEDTAIWLRALAAARPGMRLIFATSADQLSYETDNNGRFTWAFLSALRSAAPDMTQEFVSDLRAFLLASQLMEQRWGKEQLPQMMGRLGDFPLVRRLDQRVVGTGWIDGVELDPSLNLKTRWGLLERAGVATRFKCVVLDDQNGLLHQQEVPYQAQRAAESGRLTFSLPVAPLLQHPRLSSLYVAGQPLTLPWILVVEDQQGQRLDFKMVWKECRLW
jgi:hypothetical protein